MVCVTCIYSVCAFVLYNQHIITLQVQQFIILSMTGTHICREEGLTLSALEALLLVQPLLPKRF